jgi:hypothetical protein
MVKRKATKTTSSRPVKKGKNAAPSSDTVWSHEETLWIKVYHLLILTYALRKKEPSTIFSRRNMHSSFTTEFETRNADSMSEFLTNGRFPKRNFIDWEAKCRELIPRTLARIEGLVKYTTNQREEEFEPYPSHDFLAELADEEFKL